VQSTRKLRSAVAKALPGISPVNSVFPDQAARQIAARQAAAGESATTAASNQAASSTSGPVIESATDEPVVEASGSTGGDTTGAPGCSTVSGGVTCSVTDQVSMEATASGDSAQTTATGGQTATEDASTDVGGSSTNQGTKRPLDDTGGLDDRAGEASRTDDNREGRQDTQTNSPPVDHCAIAAAGLQRFRAELASRPFGSAHNVEDAVAYGIELDDVTVFRAINVVTEAISELPGAVQFSQVDPQSLTLARNGQPIEPSGTRPGNEALIPWIAGDGHSSLYVLRRESGNTFAMDHYDSAQSDGHRGRMDNSFEPNTTNGNHIRTVMFHNGWNWAGNNTIGPGVPRDLNATRQHQGWECGIHVVLSAWAYALGLQPAYVPQDADSNYNDFLRQAGDMINLAMQGLMDSETIRAFLECFKFIRAGETVPQDRSFDHTLRLETNTDYMQHNARVAIMGDLDRIRIEQPGRHVPSLDEIIAQILEGGEQPILADYTAERLLDLAERYADIFRLPGANANNSTNGPPITPPDPAQADIERILHEEAAARVAEAARVADAAASNAQTTPDANTNNTLNDPHPQTPNPDDQRRDRSGTPGSIVGSDDANDDDAFFGASPPRRLPPAFEPLSAELATFRAAEARRRATAQAAAGRLRLREAEHAQHHAQAQANVAVNEDASLSSSPAQQGLASLPRQDSEQSGASSTMPSGVSDQGMALPGLGPRSASLNSSEEGALGSLLDAVEHAPVGTPGRAANLLDAVEHAPVGSPERADNLLASLQRRHPQEDDAPGEETYQEEAVEEDAHQGDDDNDNDSLFEDSPPSPPGPPAGLSLPPTPARSNFFVPPPPEPSSSGSLRDDTAVNQTLSSGEDEPEGGYDSL
jgi:hypothetical protein